MGRKYKERLIPEQNRRICGSICFCQLTMVASCVALVYLTVAIYIPSHRAFRSGLEPVPVMCHATNTTMANSCQWASCGEWCLTKTSGFCPQIHVEVRRNGTDIVLQDCQNIIDTACPPANPESLTRFNCNNGSECETLTGMFNCSLGHCTNMSRLFQCWPRGRPDGQVINSERDNMKLNGFFECQRAACHKVTGGLHCDRYCDHIDTRNHTVYVLHGDSVLAARCRRVLSLHAANGTAPGQRVNATEFWPPDGTNGSSADVLIASCLTVSASETTINATDCINGTVVAASQIPQPSVNFTTFWSLVANSNMPADPTQRYVPLQSSLTIYNDSRLYINLEACVNTLKGECKDFLNTHGRDGDNQTAQSRFPCFYDKTNGFMVVARFDLSKTVRELVIAVAVPTVLFFVSWITLCIITRSVRVGDDAKMRCKYCVSEDADSCNREEETNMITRSESEPEARDNRAMVVAA